MAASMSRRLVKCANYLRYCYYNSHHNETSIFRPMSRFLCTEALPTPPPDGEKVYPQKLHGLVDEISQLTLREASQLNELLKVLLDTV